MAKKQRSAKPPAERSPDDFPRFVVTVDVVILTIADGALKVLLVRRGGEPYQGSWALPGGFKRPDETLDEAAARELREGTGVAGARRLTQFGTYGDPDRDPRMNVVTVAYFAVLADVGTLAAGTDVEDVALWPVAEIADGRLELAFDHGRIVTDALERAGTDLEVSDLATAFVGPEFTLTELRTVYEAVWATSFDPANFRRSLLAEDAVTPTGKRAPSGSDGGRPPELFRATRSFKSLPPVSRPRPSAKPARASRTARRRDPSK